MILLKARYISLLVAFAVWTCLEGCSAWIVSRNLVPGSSSRPAASLTTVEDESRLSINTQDDENYRLRFGGVGRLYQKDSSSRPVADTIDNKSLEAETVLQRLKVAKVAVVGLGGVGSWAAEALCRSGVGNLLLIDLDDICISNTNRQLHALSSSVGAMKIDEMKRRLLDINPDCNITLIHDFISADNVQAIIGNQDLTAVLDAIDGGTEKSALMAACADLAIPIITCGGTAGRKDPTQIACDDITRVAGDKLIGTCRKILRRDYGFEPGLPFHEQKKQPPRRKWNIDCVYSKEEPKQASDIRESSFRRCDGALGTACFVTGTAGFVMASRIVDSIVEDTLRPPRK